jgi:hypothetical protein
MPLYDTGAIAVLSFGDKQLLVVAIVVQLKAFNERTRQSFVLGHAHWPLVTDSSVPTLRWLFQRQGGWNTHPVGRRWKGVGRGVGRALFAGHARTKCFRAFDGGPTLTILILPASSAGSLRPLGFPYGSLSPHRTSALVLARMSGLGLGLRRARASVGDRAALRTLGPLRWLRPGLSCWLVSVVDTGRCATPTRSAGRPLHSWLSLLTRRAGCWRQFHRYRGRNI